MHKYNAFTFGLSYDENNASRKTIYMFMANVQKVA